MRKTRLITAQVPAWSAIAALVCTVMCVQPAQALDASLNEVTGSNQASGTNKGTLNFVDADIE